MNTTMVYSRVRAIYHNGVLSLLDPLDLPEGTQVSLDIQFTPSYPTDKTYPTSFVYPTRLVPAERLDNIIGLVAAGGNALTDSEALYDTD